MPTYANTQMQPPKSWDEFEAIVCSAAKNRWKSPNFYLHGNQGQPQDGVDVYGKDEEGRQVGIQCKNTRSGLSEATIQREVNKAESFTPKLAHFFIATTTNTDKNLQAFVRELSSERIEVGKFEVSILFWTDVWHDLTLDESRLFQHYPQLKPKAQASEAPSHDQRLYEELKTALGFEPAVRLLRDHDFGGKFLHKTIRPLFDFYDTWDQPEKEFIDTELQTGLTALYEAARELSNHLTEKTVPVGNGDYASVFSDSLRAAGPRPEYVREEARVLNTQARSFVRIYNNFMRLCRDKLVS